MLCILLLAPARQANIRNPKAAALCADIFQINLHIPKANVCKTLGFLNVNCELAL